MLNAGRCVRIGIEQYYTAVSCFIICYNTVAHIQMLHLSVITEKLLVS